MKGKTMEQIFWVKNGELEEVNKWLQKGGKVKLIHPISEPIVAYGYAGGNSGWEDKGNYVGDIYAYVVIEFD